MESLGLGELSKPLQVATCCFFICSSVKRWSYEHALAAAAIIGFLTWLFERLTRFELPFPVVYLVPSSESSATSSEDRQGEVIVSGCRVREMPANSSALDRHLSERALRPLKCKVFEEDGLEWVLYARLGDASIASTSAPSEERPRQGRRNAVASGLFGAELRGPAVVVPLEREWRPKGMGRIDWMSGAAKKRIAWEKPRKTVSREAVLRAFAAASGGDVRDFAGVRAVPGVLTSGIADTDGSAVADCAADTTDAAVAEGAADADGTEVAGGLGKRVEECDGSDGEVQDDDGVARKRR